MSATAVPARPNPVARAAGGLIGRIRRFGTGITAVSARELRGRMRGRRAFVVVTIYLLLLSAFAFGIYAYLRQQADLQSTLVRTDMGFGSITPGYALSSSIGHAIFSGLLLVETLLVLVLAPAFTTGAISMEREKQTIDLLVATPLSTLGMVIGKLFSALTYVFLLILASIPLMAIVFVFGGVGPEDVVRAYALLFALAFGMGAIGLFVSALVRRTQTATVLTFVVVLALTLGSAAVHEFWTVLGTNRPPAPEGFVTVQKPFRAPVAVLWLNPFVGDLDLICTTAPGGYDDSCAYVAAVTGTPFFGVSNERAVCGPNQPCQVEPMAVDDAAVAKLREIQAAGAVIDFEDGAWGPVIEAGVDVDRAFMQQPQPVLAAAAEQALPTFGFPRDRFWPQSVAAFLVTGLVLTFLAAQLVAPTRRLHLPRVRRSGPTVLPAAPPPPAPDSESDEVTP
jgi:ABC-type transport system involved in multi-copper enzyme maturation permease subunit